MYKQIIIARKDLNMSPGKLAAQVSHGSMAFLTTMIKENYSQWISGSNEITTTYYTAELKFDKDLYEQWINGIFTKTILAAKNRNQLLKAKILAEELGLKEGVDFFLIKDACLTELEPEEIDENGIGRTLTCIGFRPFDSEFINQIGKKYQLYK